MWHKISLVMICLIFFFIFTTAAQANTQVIVDGKTITFDTQPIIEQGKMLVQLQSIFEALDATVNWDATTQTITIKKDDTNIKLVVSGQAYKNDQVIALDVSAKILDGRTLVPLRFVSEALGANVSWNDGVVIVSTKSITTGADQNGFQWSDDGTSITITGYTGAQRGSLKIPADINGKPVKVIGENAFQYCNGFTGSLTIPDSVTSIDRDAFDGCAFTGSLIIPDSVTSIGDSSFLGCAWLTGPLMIPDSVTSIGKNAFAECSGFTGALTIPNSITLINDGAFANCLGLTSIMIPDSVTSINGAFYGCSGLTSITIPSSVTSISDYAFYGCSELISVIIPSSVTSISDYAFYNCNGRLTIYGYKDTAAERYANKNGILFSDLSSIPTVQQPGNQDLV